MRSMISNAKPFCHGFRSARWAAVTISARRASILRRRRPGTSLDRRCTSTAAWPCSKPQHVSAAALLVVGFTPPISSNEINISAASKRGREGLKKREIGYGQGHWHRLGHDQQLRRRDG